MSIPRNINKEHLLSAIYKIDEEGIPTGGDSQSYDVVYKEKRYPPKLIVSYSNLFANGEILNRNSFEGGIGTPCFNLLTENGFVIDKKPTIKSSEPKVWFVTQGTTYTSEKGMKFLFAPAKGKDDKERFYWSNLLKVKKGDIIFNHSKGIKGVSIATSDGYDSINEDTASPWAAKGFRVDIELTPLSPVISRVALVNNKDKINTYLQSVTNKPFNTVGTLNQGYLYEFTPEAGKFIRNMYGKPFGNKIIDDFFDKINSLEPKIEAIDVLKFTYKSFHQKTKEAGLTFSEKIVARFVASLCTKPFVICSGLSGSGKTKLAQSFVQWICESEEQYKIVPVGADWTNREPLLGFPNGLDDKNYVFPDSGALQLIIKALDPANKNKPYFLILDEMNLSHVERYFADFLSIMESHDKIKLYSGDKRRELQPEISWPKNLFIIGTVNIDETTYMFSPKVLDRANVIEFRISEKEIGEFLDAPGDLDMTRFYDASTGHGHGSSMALHFLNTAREKINYANSIKDTLSLFFKELKKIGAEFGYRSASEINRLIAMLNILTKDDKKWDEVNIEIEEFTDIAIMQKLLPKLHGSRNKLTKVLPVLGGLCLTNKEKIKEVYFDKLDSINFFEDKNIKYKISFEKICRMYKNAIENGFASYAEN